MADKIYAVIADTETTGAGPDDQVIESAFLSLPDNPAKFMKAELTDLVMKHDYYSHSVPMKLGALATHYIMPSQLEGKPLYNASDLNAPPMNYIIGHNVDFDREMLGAVGAKAICTLVLARRFFPDIDSHTQGAVLYHLARITKRPPEWARDLLRNAHSADADVYNCARILKYLIFLINKEFQPVGGLSWEDIYQVCQESRIPKVMPFGKFKGQPVEAVEPGWASWYAGCQDPKPDPFVLIALRRAGVLKDS